jgi:hypothetical protein
MAVDLFMATHNNREHGFSEAVKGAIVSQTFLSIEGVHIAYLLLLFSNA